MSKNKGDLISRERIASMEKVLSDLKELRDAAAKEPDDPYMVMIVAMLDTLIQHFEKYPTVDAVEVVRCKDCKHHCIEETECGAKYIACNRFDEVMEADDFCSYGERKDGADNGENDPR